MIHKAERPGHRPAGMNVNHRSAGLIAFIRFLGEFLDRIKGAGIVVLHRGSTGNGGTDNDGVEFFGHIIKSSSLCF